MYKESLQVSASAEHLASARSHVAKYSGEQVPSRYAADTVAGRRSPMPTGLYRRLVVKRLVDIAASLAGLLALSPLFVVVGVAVAATSPGPVFFAQLREGRGGRPIRVIKFRTMYARSCDPSGIAQAVADDPRVTPVGRFLRRRSLDELPQLLNVLRGDMSLVGPRPHPFGMMAGGRRYEELVPRYHERLAIMRPGMTGLAQACGLRGPTGDAQSAIARIEHDLAYARDFSLRLDLAIIVRTLLREILRGSGL